VGHQRWLEGAGHPTVTVIMCRRAVHRSADLERQRKDWMLKHANWFNLVNFSICRWLTFWAASV